MSWVPNRYLGWLDDVLIQGRPGQRKTHRWRCRQCGLLLRPNTAGAQSHVSMHLREKPKGEK